ncbi:MAG: hypothetical protein EPO24_09145 [Bacteroidetes bacterium]|nr:MAG: hypothetical protein EPO24_09145 [Bacteroidota bacterium]
MKNNVGVWIDRRKAIVVHVTDDVEEIHSIVAKNRNQVHSSGGEQKKQQDFRFNNHLKEYYSTVASFLHRADSILILGPDKAKTELKTSLECEDLGARIAGIETTDKMTDYQIAMKVLKHFLNPPKTIRHSNKT